jgi:hypothetical protein
MKRLLVLGAAVIGGLGVVRSFLARRGDGRQRPPGMTTRRPMMARMLERMPPDSPPKLVMSILPRLQRQNDEIIALLREQNELLRHAGLQPATREPAGTD